MLASSSEMTIALQSCDGEVVHVKRTIGLQSLFIERKIRLNLVESPIVLEYINAETLNMVVDYCNRHAELSNSNDKAALDSFDAEFVSVDRKTLFHLIHAAHYLKIYTLMDLTCQTLSHKIKGKNVEEIKEAVKNWRLE
ncbi:hypothetical protein POM88_042787 [Heracleum sosnowskyi]|uniref:SKP1-like protein n=1 Tax=Heracleum sosnowskyi TaxID=360622 RepID=A0AAD8HIJ0_9APIA|nr:hypothetical protein POM88_042787 [Heracleum sosnowskyi]